MSHDSLLRSLLLVIVFGAALSPVHAASPAAGAQPIRPDYIADYRRPAAVLLLFPRPGYNDIKGLILISLFASRAREKALFRRAAGAARRTGARRCGRPPASPLALNCPVRIAHRGSSAAVSSLLGWGLFAVFNRRR